MFIVQHQMTLNMNLMNQTNIRWAQWKFDYYSSCGKWHAARWLAEKNEWKLIGQKVTWRKSYFPDCDFKLFPVLLTNYKGREFHSARIMLTLKRGRALNQDDCKDCFIYNVHLVNSQISSSRRPFLHKIVLFENRPRYGNSMNHALVRPILSRCRIESSRRVGTVRANINRKREEKTVKNIWTQAARFPLFHFVSSFPIVREIITRIHDFRWFESVYSALTMWIEFCVDLTYCH